MVEFKFRGDDPWGEDVYVIPQYWFGVLADDPQLVLSTSTLSIAGSGMKTRIVC